MNDFLILALLADAGFIGVALILLGLLLIHSQTNDPQREADRAEMAAIRAWRSSRRVRP